MAIICHVLFDDSLIMSVVFSLFQPVDRSHKSFYPLASNNDVANFLLILASFKLLELCWLYTEFEAICIRCGWTNSFIGFFNTSITVTQNFDGRRESDFIGSSDWNSRVRHAFMPFKSLFVCTLSVSIRHTNMNFLLLDDLIGKEATLIRLLAFWT